MSVDKKHYASPLSSRYGSEAMQYIFSSEFKFKTWRKLWIALAQSEKELGLNITDQQIAEMIEHQDDINYEVAQAKEAEIRHDVMSHIYAYGQQCPLAAGIIHLGATSCYVGDNTDIIMMKEGLQLLRIKLVNIMNELSKFALKYADLPTLGYTHFQPAQPVTVGKRASLWLNDLLMDYNDLNYVLDSLSLLGCKGTTGTQASFLELFNGDYTKVSRLDELIANKVGFQAYVPVAGQTYSRKQDIRVLNMLAGICASVHKFTNDLRLLQHLKEIEEPFETKQVGSSAMAYKRNPMRCERMASLADYVISLNNNPLMVEATQWFERTLDDSANRRLALPEAFLATDGILDLYLNVVSGLVVYPKVIEAHLQAELPFMATENILMDAVKAGGNRQLLHEKIRQLSMEAGRKVKEEGKPNDLLEKISQDPQFGLSQEDISRVLDAKKYIGCCSQQVEQFISTEIKPLLDKYTGQLNLVAQINV